jgi:aspartate/tyrosine/aromatic aminotransferase
LDEKSVWDLAVDELVNRHKLVSDELQRRFRKTRPFRMEAMSEQEALYYYNQLTPEQINSLIETYGRDEVNQMIYEMEQIKRRQGEQ